MLSYARHKKLAGSATRILREDPVPSRIGFEPRPNLSLPIFPPRQSQFSVSGSQGGTSGGPCRVSKLMKALSPIGDHRLRSIDMIRRRINFGLGSWIDDPGFLSKETYGR